MKQTAVGFLMDKLFDPSTMVQEQIQWFHQAAQMEKEQMCKFADDFVEESCFSSVTGNVVCDITTEEYFDETFNTKER